jgi:hypothetical protein
VIGSEWEAVVDLWHVVAVAALAVLVVGAFAAECSLCRRQRRTIHEPLTRRPAGSGTRRAGPTEENPCSAPSPR